MLALPLLFWGCSRQEPQGRGSLTPSTVLCIIEDSSSSAFISLWASFLVHLGLAWWSLESAHNSVLWVLRDEPMELWDGTGVA